MTIQLKYPTRVTVLRGKDAKEPKPIREEHIANHRKQGFYNPTADYWPRGDTFELDQMLRAQKLWAERAIAHAAEHYGLAFSHRVAKANLSDRAHHFDSPHKWIDAQAARLHVKRIILRGP